MIKEDCARISEDSIAQMDLLLADLVLIASKYLIQ